MTSCGPSCRGRATADARPAWAEVDLGAIRHNVGLFVDRCAPAAVCAVVKADGYGHGAVEAAEAAVAGGATWLAVALVDEGVELRKAGLEVPILVLSEPRGHEMTTARQHDLRITVYSREGIRGAADAADGAPWPVHLKVNTGMNRVGAEPDEIVDLAKAIVAAGLDLEGFWTHFAVADELGNPFTRRQLDAFDASVAELAAAGLHPPVLHAANSAGAMCVPGAGFGLVRVGIAIYGIPPAPDLAAEMDLRPALTLRAEVTHVKRVAAGERVSYGLRYTLTDDANVATIPLGYADGVPRRLPAVGGEVLIGGRRHPMAGVVTMDQFMVDCGDAPVAVGDEVILIGAQGDERITADDWATPLDTIGYEVVCGIGPRVPRRYTNP